MKHRKQLASDGARIQALLSITAKRRLYEKRDPRGSRSWNAAVASVRPVLDHLANELSLSRVTSGKAGHLRADLHCGGLHSPVVGNKNSVTH